MRLRRNAALALLLGLAGVGLAAYWQITTFDDERVTDDVSMIRGLNGPAMPSSNVAVLRTDDGAVVVDTMTFAFHGRWIRERAAELGGGEVRVVINTHYHQDHTHGNPGFAAGTRVIATERARAALLERDAAYWEGAAAAFLPNETFAHGHEFELGGKTIRSEHLGVGHTDGDLVVLFEEDRVLVAGDLVFNDHYPNIDLEGGGSVAAWDATLERVLALDFDHVIPGHGPPTDRAGLLRFQRFVRELWEVSQAAVAAGLTVDEAMLNPALTTDAGFGTIGVPFVFRLDRPFVLRRGFEEASRAAAASAG